MLDNEKIKKINHIISFFTWAKGLTGRVNVFFPGRGPEQRESGKTTLSANYYYITQLYYYILLLNYKIVN